MRLFTAPWFATFRTRPVSAYNGLAEWAQCVLSQSRYFDVPSHCLTRHRIAKALHPSLEFVAW
jgi:hypothetical protein